MPKNKAPIDPDLARKQEFAEHLDTLDKSGIEYIPPSAEREEHEDWKLIDGTALESERAILTKLDELYALAQGSGLKSENERNANEAALAIDQLKKEAEAAVAEVGEVPARVRLAKEEFVDFADTKKKELHENRHKFGEDVIEKILKDVIVIFLSLKKLIASLLAQDKYGNDRMGGQGA